MAVADLSCLRPVQFVYCGKKATLSIGNVLPLGQMPEGSIICNVEQVRGLPHRHKMLGEGGV